MQSDLIEMRQFVDACALWGSRKDCALADILVEPFETDEGRQFISTIRDITDRKRGEDRAVNH